MISAQQHYCSATHLASCSGIRRRGTCSLASYTSTPQLTVTCHQKGFGSPGKQAKKSKTKVIQQETAPQQQPSLGTEWEDEPFTSTSSDEEVPEEISARVLRRILIFSGIPTFTGFLSLPLFYYLKVVQHLDIPTYAVYLASFCTFGVGILGISYGAISSSWTAAEGSRLGIKEFKRNLPVAIDRMRGR